MKECKELSAHIKEYDKVQLCPKIIESQIIAQLLVCHRLRKKLKVREAKSFLEWIKKENLEIRKVRMIEWKVVFFVPRYALIVYFYFY